MGVYMPMPQYACVRWNVGTYGHQARSPSARHEARYLGSIRAPIQLYAGPI
jgi:hypothetical protein